MLEKDLLLKLKNNKFFVQLYSTFESYSHLNFLLEFYPGGELFFHM